LKKVCEILERLFVGACMLAFGVILLAVILLTMLYLCQHGFWYVTAGIVFLAISYLVGDMLC